MSQGANAYLIDAATRHAVFLQRYAGGERKKIEAVLREMEKEIRERITRGAFADLTPAQMQRQLDAIRQISLELMGEAITSVRGEVRGLAEYEAQFAAKMLDKAINVKIDTTVAAARQIASAALAQPILGRPFTDITRNYRRDSVDRILAVTRQGYFAGDTNDVIVERIQGAIETSRRSAEAMTRTATNHYANTARREFGKEHGDILQGLRYVATLDSRTTALCASRDGNIYEIGEEPSLPAHVNCRSTYAYEVKDEYQLPGFEGERPAKGDEGITQVGANTTYSAWLKRQSADFQEQALGKTRADLFRSGRLSLDKFVDPTGDLYTLDELKNMEGITLD